MSPIALLDAGRSLADRIPQSFVSAVARVAVATVFWRSGQTKVEGFQLTEAEVESLVRTSHEATFIRNGRPWSEPDDGAAIDEGDTIQG